MSQGRSPWVVGALAVLLAACSGSAEAPEVSPSPSNTPITAAADCGDSLREITANAKLEGHLTLIAVPDDWANYGQVLESFRDDYGIEVQVLSPDASSAEELAAIRAMADSPNRPDVIDVSPIFAKEATDAGLLQPFRGTTWAQIPAILKDPDGFWVGSYYGIMAIGTNTTYQSVAADSWAELRNRRFRDQIAMDGDPRTSGAGFGAVVAAALANGGSFDNVLPGIEYFAALRKSGNLAVIDGDAVALTPQAPVALRWLFTFPQGGKASETLRITIPEDAVYGSYYAQGITADAPHPCAAALWIEHITGESGALAFLQGRALPARFAALEAFGLISGGVREKLPRPSQIYGIRFPTPTQLERMQRQIDRHWGPMVAGR